MQVVATAGHVDHGKSTLVRALTGMEPDRWEEERRRGLTIDLGFAWLSLPDGQRLAFVDVPGHERFVPNMLAGLGPVPAVLIVVAADEGWMPQSAEHLAAIDALRIRHGLLVVTRADLADPGPASRRAAAEIAATSLGAVEAVAVSGVTGAGLDDLRDALVKLAAALPVPDPEAPVRLWVDRSFSIKGSGTVVTGTLPAGTVRTGDELLLTPSMRPVRVRGIESLNESAQQVSGVARVALNLRGIARDVPARGMALVQAGGWTMTGLVDVRIDPARAERRGQWPRELILHVGSARVAARVRVLGKAAGQATDGDGAGHGGGGRHGDDGRHAGLGGGVIARLTLRDRLPLHVGDRVLLRDPGPAESVILGATVLDVMAPPLRRRGAAATAARELARWPEPPTAVHLLRRHGLVRTRDLAATGVSTVPAPVAGDWVADPVCWAGLRRRLGEAVAEYTRRHPLAPGMPIEAACAALGLQDRRLAEALTGPLPDSEPGGAPAVALAGGYLRLGRSAGPAPAGTARSRPASGDRPAGGDPLPAPVMAAVRAVLADLAQDPFHAPDAGRLRELGLDTRAIAAAARVGLLLRVGDQIVLAPGADAEAARVLAGLPQPFTTAEARQALRTTRRVAIPLLEFLDRARITDRLADDRRRVRPGRQDRR